jgi:hypothetical protein
MAKGKMQVSSIHASLETNMGGLHKLQMIVHALILHLMSLLTNGVRKTMGFVNRRNSLKYGE